MQRCYILRVDLAWSKGISFSSDAEGLAAGSVLGAAVQTVLHPMPSINRL